ncbi:MAG TPA: hypothetical protein DCZ69_04785 [Syntrophobacteraceae bacterium]|nr:hypothetical protein [Syntrophobacteraceae bacterium]HBD07555.1 hypothetical protein [Syntrophobacteraceae bacterium]HBZ54403.1 hypothetical protein [Syntrophobacteraceae bacterium]
MRNNLRNLIVALLFVLLGAGSVSAQGGDSTFQPKYYGNVPYVSGGIGLDEREALTQFAAGYDLKLMFAVAAGNYLADVRVEILDAAGRMVLQAVSEGPWFFAHLPPGRYNVAVNLAGVSQRQTVQVSGQGQTRLNFFWK